MVCAIDDLSLPAKSMRLIRLTLVCSSPSKIWDRQRGREGGREGGRDGGREREKEKKITKLEKRWIP